MAQRSGLSAPPAEPEEGAPPAAAWVRYAARTGYAAKGCVYVLVGALTVQAALIPPEDLEGAKGAMREVQSPVVGRVLLAAIAVGLAAYIVWRLVQALLDPEGRGTDARGLAHRAGYLISAGLYGTVAVQAVRLFFHLGSGGSAASGMQQAERWTALVMGQPTGRWIVGAVGLGVVGFGLYEFYKATRSHLRERLDLTGLGGANRTRLVRFGRFGLAARGVVFVVIGGFLVRAALRYEPQAAAGLGDALRLLGRQPYGRWLLGLIAFGLASYGVWQMVKARYRLLPRA